MFSALHDPERASTHCISAPSSTAMLLFSSLCCLLLIICCDNDSLFCTAAIIGPDQAVRTLKRTIKTSPVSQKAGENHNLNDVNLEDFKVAGEGKYSFTRDDDNNDLDKHVSAVQRMPFPFKDNLLQSQITDNGLHDLNVNKYEKHTEEQEVPEYKLHDSSLLHRQKANEYHHNIVNGEKNGKSLHSDFFSVNGLSLQITPHPTDHGMNTNFKDAIQKQRVRSKGVVIQIKHRLRRSTDSDIWPSSDGQNYTSASRTKQIQLYANDSHNILSKDRKSAESLLHWLCRLGSQQSCDCIQQEIPWFQCARFYHHHRTTDKSPTKIQHSRKRILNDRYSSENVRSGALLTEPKFHSWSSAAQETEKQVFRQTRDDILRLRRGITHRIDEVLLNSTDAEVLTDINDDVSNNSRINYIRTSTFVSVIHVEKHTTLPPDFNSSADSNFVKIKNGEAKWSNANELDIDAQSNQDSSNLSPLQQPVSQDNEPDATNPPTTELNSRDFLSPVVTEMYERTAEQETIYQTNKSFAGVQTKVTPKTFLESVQPQPDTKNTVLTSMNNHGGTYHIPHFSDFTVKIQTLNQNTSEVNTSYDGTVQPPNWINTSAVVPMFAVPQPEWSTAKQLWQGAWGFHVYTVAVVFTILALYLTVSIFRLYRMKNFLSQGYFLSLTTIIFVMSFFRAFYFWIDGYNSNKTFPPILAYFLYTMSLPCITSAFSILFLALLNSTKMQLLSKRIQKPKVIGGIIFFHFLLSLVTDIIVGSFYKSKVMFFICQIAFVMWGLILFGGYIYIFRKLYVAAKSKQKELERMSLNKVKLQGVSPIRKPPKLALNLAIKVTLITAIFGLMMAMLQVYAMTGVHSIFSKEKPLPWPWWWFQFGVRLVEIGMCVTMSFVATQPIRYNQTDKQRHCLHDLLHMSPCKRLFECDSYQTTGNHEVYWDDSSTVFVNIEENPLDLCTFNTDEQDTGRTTAEEMEPLNGFCSSNKDTNGTIPQSTSRPQSMLISDNGFIRFRQEHDVDVESVVMSTDDELDCKGDVDEYSTNSFPAYLKNNGNIGTTNCNTSLEGDNEYQVLHRDNNNELNSNELVSNLDTCSPRRPDNLSIENYDCLGDVSDINSPLSDGQVFEDYLSVSDISLKPPSSLNLGLSIENALNIRIVDIDINDNSRREELGNNFRRCSDSDVLEATETMQRSPKIFAGKSLMRELDKAQGNCSSSETPDSDIHSVKTLLCRSNSESRSSTFSQSTPRYGKYSYVPDSSDADSNPNSPKYQNSAKRQFQVEENLCENSRVGQQPLDSSFSDVCYAIDQLNSQTNQDFHYL